MQTTSHATTPDTAPATAEELLLGRPVAEVLSVTVLEGLDGVVDVVLGVAIAIVWLLFGSVEVMWLLGVAVDISIMLVLSVVRVPNSVE